VSGAAARVSVSVRVDPATAFELFTRDIDRWWRRGVKFRHSIRERGLFCLEPRTGGRLFESMGERGSEILEVGLVQVWDPPRRLVFTWRNAAFAPHERTLVEVEFTATPGGTLVAVTHRGLTSLPADHPARHGLEDAEFIRSMGLWWGALMSAYRHFAAQYSN
jgi:uncharacterized protein YndB with AHSA1/START domain